MTALSRTIDNLHLTINKRLKNVNLSMGQLLNVQRKTFGFTLIELIIVMALWGILATIIMVAVNPGKRINQAKDSQVKSDLQQITSAIVAYNTIKLNTYPSDLQTLEIDQDLKRVPTDPSGDDYTYLKIPEGCLGTSGPLNDPTIDGNVWCWQSMTGRFLEVAEADCTPDQVIVLPGSTPDPSHPPHPSHPPKPSKKPKPEK